MKQHLVIQLSAARVDGDTPVAWHLFGASGALERRGITPLGQVRAEVGTFHDGATVVLVPGEFVFLTSAYIPSRQARQIRQALPYMVEELIADNIEDVHLATPDITPGGEHELPVGVVQHHLLIDWLDQLYQHGITADALCPDTLAAPWRQGSHTFFVQDGRVICRDGAYRGQAMSREQFATYLQLLKQDVAERELGAPLRHIVHAGTEAVEPAQAVLTAVQAEIDGDTTLVEYGEDGAEVLAAYAVQHVDELLNLLQGGYRVQRRGQTERQWARVAAVAGIGIALYCAVAGASGAWFSYQAQKAEQQTFSLYRQLFPNERRVVSPKKQMQAHLGGAVTGASPLPLLAKTALGLRGNELQLDELHYRRQRNDLQLQLHTPTLETLDKIKQQLGGVGLQVDISSAAQQGNQTIGRLNIRDARS